MAKISARLPASNRTASGLVVPAPGRASAVCSPMPVAEVLLADDEGAGPGWFDSTWALVQGLDVSECPGHPLLVPDPAAVQAHAPARAPA